MPAAQRRVIDAIIDCRSAACGAILYQCEDCGEPHVAARCCGNRHCPVCQQGKAEAWLIRQHERQLPTPYFMLTFTVPSGLREFLRRHPRIGYGALFAASAGAIKTLAADDKHLGADLPGFFLPVRALSPIFRAKFRDAMRAAGLLAEIDPCVWTVDWNVNCQAVGDAAASLAYLSRYVFKVGISEGRIVRADAAQVVFRYRKVGSSRPRTLALATVEFMRRFLQHVLPRGFMKVRYFGFLSPSFSMSIEELKGRIELAQGFTVAAAPTPAPTEASRSRACPHCGEILRCRSVVLPRPFGSRGLLRPAVTSMPFAAGDESG
ncbi:MAG: transposase [Sulfuritalea sp.]|nr:transposase [Sulfuritalea sp.]